MTVKINMITFLREYIEICLKMLLLRALHRGSLSLLPTYDILLLMEFLRLGVSVLIISRPDPFPVMPFRRIPS